MDLNKLHDNIVELVRNNRSFLKITAEQMMNEVAAYCKENGVETNSSEYTVVTNYARLWIMTHFELELSLEKMKHETSKPKKIDLDDLDIE